jgi:hypothetical protein
LDLREVRVLFYLPIIHSEIHDFLMILLRDTAIFYI